MSNNPPYPPPGGQPPGGYPQGPPGYGQPQPFGPPGQPGQPAYGAPYGQPNFAPPNQPSKRWYQRWWVWLVAAIALIIVALVIVGALFGNKYQLETKIKSALQNAGHTASNVSCPNNINTDKGHTYVCTATVDGQQTSLNINFDADRHFLITQAS